MLTSEDMISLRTVLGINLAALISSFILSISKASINTRMIVSNMFMHASTLAIFFLLSNEKKVDTPAVNKEPEQVLQVYEVDPSTVKIYKNLDLNNNEVKADFNVNDTGLYMKQASLKNFNNANALNDSSLQINFVDSDGTNIKWLSFNNDELTNVHEKVGITAKQEGYVTRLSLNVANLIKPKILLSYKTKEVKQEFRNNNKVAIGYNSKYWASYVIVDKEQMANSKINDDRINIEISNIKDKSNNIILDIVNIPLKIAELERTSMQTGFNLTSILKLSSGFLWGVKGFFLYYSMLIFDYITSIVKHPLFSVMMIIFLIRIVMLYPNYRSFLFGVEFKKATDLATTTNSPDLIMKTLQSNNISFVEQGVWLFLRIAILLIVYGVIQRSPLFYSSQFLWIKDLSAPDNAHLANLFGLVPKIPYLPEIGLVAILAAGAISFEILRKNMKSKNPKGDQGKYMLYIIPTFLVLAFFRMQSALCIYILTTTLIDQVQTYIFGRFRNRSSRGKKKNKFAIKGV